MNIAEIRKKYPQYDDLSDQELADKLHAKFYADMPQSEFYSKVGLEVKGEDKSLLEKGWDRLDRQIRLGGRYGLEGIAKLASIVTDPVAVLLNAAGANIPSLSTAVPELLTQAGIPEAETAGERIAAEANRGGAAGVVMGPAAFLPGVTGGAAAGAAQEAGAGPVGQAAAGLAGGAAGAVAGPAARYAGRAVKDTVTPFFRGGQERAVGRVLNRQATNPEAAQIAATNPQQLVAGSQPTLGQATRDPGLLGLERGVRNINPAEFTTREAQQNAARRAVLQSFSMADDEIAQAKEFRDRLTQPLLKNAFASTRPVNNAGLLDDVDKMMSAPRFQGGASQVFLKRLRKQLEGQADPEALYSIRKDVAAFLESNPNKSLAPQAATQLKNTRAAATELLKKLDDYIERGAPGYTAYRKRFAELSRRINRGELGQKLLEKSENTSVNPVTGEYVLSPAKWINNWRRHAGDIKKTLTERQQRRLSALTREMERGTLLNSVRPSGSDTMQNLNTANLLGNLLGDKVGNSTVLQGSLGRPLAWIYRLPEQKAQELLVEAILDPELAAQLMKRATAENVRVSSEMLAQKLGAMGAVAMQTEEEQ